MAVCKSGAIMYGPGGRTDRKEVVTMRYLHTMLRVRNLDAALDFYCNKLGLVEVRRRVDEKNKYTLVFLAGPEDEELVAESKRTGRDAPLVELTYNWDTEDYGEARYFGHLAYEVDDIYALCEKLMKAGVTINRPPRDGTMAFVRSLLIAAFGAAGAVSRYAVDGWVSDATHGQFPWGTLVVNLAGAFALGVVVAITTERMVVGANFRIALGIGFLGSFTTFSTYAYETIRLAEDGALSLAFLNAAGMVALGLLAAAAGLAVGRAV